MLIWNPLSLIFLSNRCSESSEIDSLKTDNSDKLKKLYTKGIEWLNYLSQKVSNNASFIDLSRSEKIKILNIADSSNPSHLYKVSPSLYVNTRIARRFFYTIKRQTFEIFYTNEFTNINLAANDSIWINLGLVSYNTYLFTDTIDIDLCVYTSHPNHVTDTIVPNDQFCTKVFFGIVGLSENILQNISVFPNPVKDVIHIENPDLKSLYIYVYNNLGKVISTNSGSKRRYSVDLSNQSSGLYLVRIVSKDAEVTQKLIKQ